MTTKDAALKLALEALEYIEHNYMSLPAPAEKAITAIREALAEQPAQQQEPYGRVTVVRRPGCVDQHWFYRWPEPPYLDNAAECHTVYTYPPASKPWVGLTEEEIQPLLSQNRFAVFALARAIEAKLREKNA